MRIPIPAVAASALLLSACSHGSTSAATTPAAETTAPRRGGEAGALPSMVTGTAISAVQVSAGTFALKPGSLSGTVLLDGDPPPIAKRAVTVDTGMCGTAPKEDRSLVVDPASKAVRYAVVTLTPRSPGATAAAAAGRRTLPPPPTIEQTRCEFYPYVTLIPPGGSVAVVNNDAGLHDLHRLDPDGHGSHDASPPGARVLLTFARPGATKLVCDLHYWASAWIFETDAPLAVVTDADGAFRFPAIPAGAWTLSVWQERLGVKSIDLTIPAGEHLTQTVTFPLPQPLPPGETAPPASMTPTPGPSASASASPSGSGG